MAHYGVFMRTTLTIDDDDAMALKALARNSGKTFKAVVNEVMRNGLMTGEKPAPEREAFQVASRILAGDRSVEAQPARRRA